MRLWNCNAVALYELFMFERPIKSEIVFGRTSVLCAVFELGTSHKPWLRAVKLLAHKETAMHAYTNSLNRRTI